MNLGQHSIMENVLIHDALTIARECELLESKLLSLCDNIGRVLGDDILTMNSGVPGIDDGDYQAARYLQVSLCSLRSDSIRKAIDDMVNLCERADADKATHTLQGVKVHSLTPTVSPWTDDNSQWHQAIRCDNGVTVSAPTYFYVTL